jgi:DNA-binding protein Fis
VKKQLEGLVRQMIDKGLFFDEATKEFEKTFIMAGLEKAEGNRTKAAKMIGLHRNTFRNKFLSHGLSASQINSKRNKNRLTH